MRGEGGEVIALRSSRCFESTVKKDPAGSSKDCVTGDILVWFLP